MAQVRQIDNITGLRGFAAISVMLLHIRSGQLADSYGWFAFVFANGGYGVDVFFILSGFILAYVHGQDFANGVTMRGARDFLIARLARIYPVHLFMLIMVALVLRLHGITDWSPIDTARAFYANLALVHAWGTTPDGTFNQPSWSISAEWAAYLLFPLLAFITAKWPRAVCLVVGIYAALSPALYNWVHFKNGEMAFRCVGFFTGGFLAYRTFGVARDSRLWAAGVWVAIAALLLGLKYLRADGQYPYLFAIAATALIVCLFKSHALWLFSNPVSVFLGRISYSLYMSHVVVIFSIRKLSGGMQPMWVELAWIFAIATLIYYMVEEPARKTIRGMMDYRRLKALAV